MELSNADIAKFVTRQIIEKQADVFNKDLPVKFWNVPPWKSQYRVLIMRVNNLLKTYEPMAVYEAFNTKEGKNIYSLKYPGLDDLLIKHERILAKSQIKAKNEVEIKTVDIKSKPRKVFAKKNVRDLLD